MKWKNMILTVLIALVLFLPLVTAQTPSLTLSETEISPSDTVFVYGTDFDPNTTVRIDLYLPTGIIIEGVAYNITDENGTFSASFVAPDSPAGYGYVKAISGEITVSKYVYFKGSVQYSIDVNMPDTAYVGEQTNITVEATFMSGNHILDVIYYRPDNSILKEFYVLNDGYSSFTKTFQMVGTYEIVFSIEDTPYNTTKSITVVEKPVEQEEEQEEVENTTTVNWYISKNVNVYLISLEVNNNTILNGNINLYRPDGTKEKLKIEDGTTVFTANRVGTYELQYIKDGKIYRKQIGFNPKLSLTATVDETGIITVKFTVDNLPYTVTATLYKGTTKVKTYEFIDGEGTFKVTESADYTIKVKLFNMTTTATVSYKEDGVMDNLMVSEDKGMLWITGEVIGKYSGKPIKDKTVRIDITDVGSVYATTDENGRFMQRVDVSDKLGETFYITANIGDFQKTVSIKTEKDFWGAYGWLIAIIVILILGILYKYGYFDFLKPKSKSPTKEAVRGRLYRVGR